MTGTHVVLSIEAGDGTPLVGVHVAPSATKAFCVVCITRKSPMPVCSKTAEPAAANGEVESTVKSDAAADTRSSHDRQ